MYRVSALASIVLIGLSAGAARAQQVVPVGLFSPGCGSTNCGLPQDACLVAVPCNDKHECCVKAFLDKVFGLRSFKKPSARRSCASPCGPTCAPQCPPGCVPAHQHHVCTPACQPAPFCQPAPQACAAPCAPPAPRYTSVPVKLMMLCRVPQPAPVCQQACAPMCQPAPVCQQACAPMCPPGCAPAQSCASCGHKLIQFNGFFHRHSHGQPCTPSCAAPGCSTCGEAAPFTAPAAQQPGQPATLPPSASLPTAAYPQSYPQGYPQAYQPNGYAPGYLTSQQSAPQAMPQVAPGPYGQLIMSIQAAQDRDNKALRDMIETRQATQAVVRALQASDSNTVEMFEKMIQQMKGTPTIPNVPTGPTSAAPSIVAPIPGTSMAPMAGSTILAVDEMKSILRDLQSPAVRTASAGSR